MGSDESILPRIVRPAEEAPPAVCSRWMGPGPCGAAAVSHVIWDLDGYNGAVCPTHEAEVRTRWVFVGMHPYGHACTFGAEHWRPDENRCALPTADLADLYARRAARGIARTNPPAHVRAVMDAADRAELERLRELARQGVTDQDRLVALERRAEAAEAERDRLGRKVAAILEDERRHLEELATAEAVVAQVRALADRLDDDADVRRRAPDPVLAGEASGLHLAAYRLREMLDGTPAGQGDRA